MSVKIVHCADIHIGFYGSNRYTAKRRREVLQTFLRAIDFAEEKKADLFLISGDLFDSHRVSREALGDISQGFSKFSGKVFIAPGNHDYYGENTFWEKWELPENVTVFKDSAQSVTLADSGVVIHGGAFDGAYKKSHILREISAKEGFINIALIHGELTPDSLYGPVDLSDIRQSNMDYIALGHIHKRSELRKEGNTVYAYPGCIEGQGFDETGEKGIYFGTIEKGNADLEFIPLCTRRFEEERIDISMAEHKSEIPDIILRKIKEKYGTPGLDWLYKIILSGETSLAVSPAEISAVLENSLYFVKIKDKTKAPLGDLEALAGENSIKGIFTRKMLQRMKDGSSEEAENALRIGLAAFSEEVAFDED